MSYCDLAEDECSSEPREKEAIKASNNSLESVPTTVLIKSPDLAKRGLTAETQSLKHKVKKLREL